MLRQAGTTPPVPTRPGVGFRPTMLLKPAGTRPEPAVSVPSANGTWPVRHHIGRARAGAAADALAVEGCWAPRHRASACRPGRWRTGRGWSCRRRSHRRRAAAAPRWRARWRAGGEGRAGRGGGQAGHVDVVLDGEGHAEQRLRLEHRGAVAEQARVAGVGLGHQGFVGQQRDPGLLGLLRLLGQEAQHQLPHRHGACAQRLLQLRQSAWFDHRCPVVVHAFLYARWLAEGVPVAGLVCLSPASAA